MPTYEYRCSNCSHLFEEFQSMKDAPLITCPRCKQDRLARVIGAGGGAIFKGSGFYQTDYKGGNTSSRSAAAEKKKDSSPPESPSKPSPEKKSDT